MARTLKKPVADAKAAGWEVTVRSVGGTPILANWYPTRGEAEDGAEDMRRLYGAEELNDVEVRVEPIRYCEDCGQRRPRQ